MKLTVNLKIVDVILQILALFAPIVIDTLPSVVSEARRDDGLLWFYYTVGAVQFTSCVINRIFLQKGIRGQSRIGYEVLLGLITLLAIGSRILPRYLCVEDILLFFLIFFSPIMAIWYFLLSINEVINAKTYSRPNAEDLATKSLQTNQ